MANIQASKLNCVVLADAISTTGKYYIFLGEHYVKGIQCYDVAALARTDQVDVFAKGVVIRRHYRDKAEALAYWQEFRDKMTAPRPDDESDEPLPRSIIHEPKKPN